jgi:lipoate-protein ligase A
MAVDEALLDLHLQGKTPPTLRFYGWAPPAVSFGYAQKVSDATIERIKKAGYDVVRRPTGGRAVLHEGELTYCFIAASKSDVLDFSTGSDDINQKQKDFQPESLEAAEEAFDESPYEAILEPSVARAYRQICEALINGLTELGVETSMGKSADGSYKGYEDCFQATTQADLQYQGKKIVGSAQLRRRHGVMQHGSLMLNQPQDKMAELLGSKVDSENYGNDQKDQVDVLQRHFNLCDILKSAVDRTAIEEAIGKGFAKAFDCRFAVCDIKDEEWAHVETLKADQSRYRVFPDRTG